MNFLKIMQIILMVAFLSSCDEEAEKVVTVQCQPFLKEVLVSGNFIIDGSEVYLENQRFIDVKKSGCNCREYTYSLERIGALTNFETRDISYCHQLVGHPVKKWPLVWRFLEDVRQMIHQDQDGKSTPEPRHPFRLEHTR